MIHPSYSELIKIANTDVAEGETPIVKSRYSIVHATAKRARQLIDGQEPLISTTGIVNKPLSIAIAELGSGEVKIIGDE